jgi:ATP-binding cassette subfamily F protein 3
VDELRVDETPLQHIQRELPDQTPAQLRARLAGFGLMAERAETEVGRLSGGQKARLSLLLATLPAPHLLILDEPTNHLDIESREALMEALNAYSGAVVLVSHDMHLLSMVADRLWLVSGGTVKPYDDDLSEYRRMLLQSDAPAKQASKPAAPKRAGRDQLLTLRAEVRKCEERVEKLSQMEDKLQTLLNDPELFTTKKDQAVPLQKKYAELQEAMARAETLWMEALEKLEEAENP